MQTTFTHKVLITIVAGFFAASLIQFYRYFVEGANDAVNAGYEQRANIPRR